MHTLLLPNASSSSFIIIIIIVIIIFIIIITFGENIHQAVHYNQWQVFPRANRGCLLQHRIFIKTKLWSLARYITIIKSWLPRTTQKHHHNQVVVRYIIIINSWQPLTRNHHQHQVGQVHYHHKIVAASYNTESSSTPRCGHWSGTLWSSNSELISVWWWNVSWGSPARDTLLRFFVLLLIRASGHQGP